MQEREPNRLIDEKSPYLLKHAYNPVRWYSWGKEAFAKAKNDNKPIFLSIGYSACHWCSVMERESFEDQKTAAFVNRHFIPIKVDREERPEVDAYYMSAVQAMTGGGGWPLTVFLTPDLKPFYGGAYFPPLPRLGMPSFMQVLEFVANLWKDKRDEVKANSEQVLKAIEPDPNRRHGEISATSLDDGYASLVASFDEERGGFGRAPKFPLPGTLSFLLRYHYRTGKELALKVVLKTLDEMMAGGIRDHVGGGFHRYSTDRVWLVPHFEKMLYDNALLARVFAEAYQVTGKDDYAQVARETLDWIVGEMKDEGGGFYSAQDADTTEGEGTYYTWTLDELEAALGQGGAGRFGRLYGVTKNGNFDGRSLLHLQPGVRIPEEEKKALARSKELLYTARNGRPKPATDTKVMTSWNGLAVSGLALCSGVLKEERYAEAARSAAGFILKSNVRVGRLLRRYAGGESALDGTLEDYAFFIQGLLDLFEATSEPRWLLEALRLGRVMIDGYEDGSEGGFYLSLEGEPVRLKESYDGPTPSGNSIAALDLVRLAELTGDEKFRKAAERCLAFFTGEIERNPSGHTTMLSAADLLLNGMKEVVLSAPSERSAQEMKVEALNSFVPDKVVLVATPRTYEELSRVSPLLEGRRPGAKVKAYVCQNFTCKLPVDTPEALREQLRPKKG